MMQRLAQIVDAGAGLLGAQSQVFLRDFERAGASVVTRLLGALALLVGACVLAAALALVLAEWYGWPVSLGIIGGGFVLAGGGVLLMPGRRREGSPVRSRAELEAEVARKQAELRTAAAGGDEAPANDSAQSGVLAGIAEDAIKAVSGKAEILASGAFALLSLFGPGRTLRVLGKTAAAAGAAASIARTLQSLDPTVNGHAPKAPAAPAKPQI